MKSALIFATTMVATALAKPFVQEKRYYVTETVIETATVTVTGGFNAWIPWGAGRQTSTTTLAITISSPAPATTSPSSPSSSSQVVLPAPSTSSSPSSSSTEPSTSTVVPPPSTSSSSTTSAAAAANTSASSNPDSKYSAPILEQHNLHRNNHSANPIVWDDGLARIAQQIASSCVYAHDLQTGGGGYGQNIGAGAPPDEVNRMITNQMYNNELMLYPAYGVEPDMSNFEAWGHFSQIVWKQTTTVGCFTQYCPGGLGNIQSDMVSKYFTVCNYKPGGKSRTSPFFTARTDISR